MFKGCKGENCNSQNQENWSASLNIFRENNIFRSKRKRRKPSDMLPVIWLINVKLFSILGYNWFACSLWILFLQGKKGYKGHIIICTLKKSFKQNQFHKMHWYLLRCILFKIKQSNKRLLYDLKKLFHKIFYWWG